MLSRKLLLVGSLLLTLPLQALAAKKPCLVSQLETQLGTSTETREGSRNKGKPVALPPGGDLRAFQDAPVIAKGGVTHGPICNQQGAEICWAYTENEFASALLLKNTGKLIQTSPDHSGFWHLYSQVYNNSKYFLNLSERVNQKKISLKTAIAEAKRFLRGRKGFRATPNSGFEIQPGSNEAIALNESANFGMVPNTTFDHPITTPEQGQAFSTALTKLVTTIIKSPNKTSLFGAADADGVNTPLYQLMTQNLQPFYEGSGTGSTHLPYRPSDTFTYNGNQYTPGTFMTQVMKFDPSQWSQVTLTNKNQTALMQAVHESLAGADPVPVPIGFAVYNQQAAQQAPFTWSVDLFNGQQPHLDGGHEIMIVNGRTDSSGKLIGVTAQNSWGTGIGNDANGNPTNVAADSGFFNITTPYLNFTAQKDPPDFVLKKSMVGASTGLQADPDSIIHGKSPRLK